jgi:hypothetical protein
VPLRPTRRRRAVALLIELPILSPLGGLRRPWPGRCDGQAHLRVLLAAMLPGGATCRSWRPDCALILSRLSTGRVRCRAAQRADRDDPPRVDPLSPVEGDCGRGDERTHAPCTRRVPAAADPILPGGRLPIRGGRSKRNRRTAGIGRARKHLSQRRAGRKRGLRPTARRPVAPRSGRDAGSPARLISNVERKGCGDGIEARCQPRVRLAGARCRRLPSVAGGWRRLRRGARSRLRRPRAPGSAARRRRPRP